MKKAVLVLSFLSLLLPGCVKDEEAGSAAGALPEDNPPVLSFSDPQEPDHAGAGEEPAQADGPEDRRLGGTGEAEAENRPADSPARGRNVPEAEKSSPAAGERLAFRGPSEPKAPEDMTIGLLALRPETSSELGPAGRFLRELGRGNFLQEDVLPGQALYLKSIVLPILEQETPLQAYRLGAAQFLEGNIVCVNFRLYGDTGRAFGKLFLEESEGAWYVSDIQGDMEELTVPYVREFDLYEPQVFRWLEF